MAGPFDTFGQSTLEYNQEAANVAAQQAMAQLHSAHAYQATVEADQLRAFTKALQDQSTAPPQPTTGDPLMDMGNQLAAISQKTMSVAPMQAGKLAAQAAGLQAHASQMKLQAANVDRVKLETQHRALEELSGFLATADTPEKWNAGLLAYQASNPGEQIPQVFQNFDPAVRERLLNGTKAGMDRIKQQLLADRQDALEGWRQDRLQFQQDRDAWQKAAREQQLAIQEARAKVAGNKPGPAEKPIGAPDAATRKQAGDMIRETYPELPANEADGAAFSIASRAMALVKANPGFDRQAALEKAMEEAAQSGEISTTNEAYKIFGMNVPFTETKKAHWNRRTPAGATGTFGSEAGVLELPASKGDLKTGSIYNTARGKGRWNGTAFEAVK